MKLKHVIQAKKIAEESIQGIIRRFEEFTGLSVTGVEIDQIYVQEEGKESKKLNCSDVKINVEL